jgi:hypothetical protein
MKIKQLIITGFIVGLIVLFVIDPKVIFISIGLSIPMAILINKVWNNYNEKN